MRNLLVALVILVLLVLAGAYFLGSGARSERDARSQETAGGQSAGPADPLAPITDGNASGGTRATSSGDAAREAIPATREERFGEWEAGDPLLVRGSVALPAGVPADDTLRVFALRQGLSQEALYGPTGVVRKLAQAERTELPGELLAYAPVGADGDFELPFPAGTEVAWIALDGRFLFTPECVPHRVTAGTCILKPRIGALVTGRVSGPADVPFDFARVEVDLEPDANQFSMTEMASRTRFMRAVTPDAEGRFEMRAIDAGRPYEIDITSDRLASWTRDGIVLEEGREYTVEAELVVGARLRGTVLDPNGAPVEGAEISAVKLIMWGFPGEEVATTKSAADGSFDLAAIPPGKTAIVARQPGLLESKVLELDLPDRSEHEGAKLVLEAGSTLAGRVVMPAGQPQVCARIEVEFDPAAMMGMSAMNSGRGAKGSGESRVDGAFEITGLGKGPFLVTASVPAPSGGHDWSTSQAGVAPNTRDLVLELSAPAEVHGRVVDQAGDPITRFTVIANSQGAIFFMPGEHKREEVQHENGEFVLHGLEEGMWEIDVRAPDYGAAEPHELLLPQPDLAPLLVVLGPAAGVAGTVVDPAGQPVPGAKVTLQVESGKTFAGMTGRLELPETYSDDEGGFLLQGLGEGTTALVAHHADYAVSVPVEVEVQAGEVTEEVAITLRKGGTLTGELYDREGERMAGAQVFVQDPSTWEMTLLRTEADGTFEVERIRPGQWQVTAMIGVIDPDAADGGDGGGMSAFFENMRFTMVTIAEGETTHVVLGAPPEDPVRVHGRVTHGGEAARDVTVSFFPESGKGLSAMKIDQVDGEGRYEVELEEPGRYLVQVQAFGGIGVTQQNIEYAERVPEGEEHELDFELPIASISGLVEGPDGEPLSGARISLVSEGGVKTGTFMGGQFAELTTDASGRYSLEFLRPGTYTVSAGGATFGGAFGAHSAHGRIVRENVRVKAGERIEDLDFRLEAAGDVTGFVRDASGSRISGVAIFLRDEQGRMVDRFSMITSGPGGTFRYSGLAPGRYAVSGRLNDQVNSSDVWARVESAESAEVELVVEAGTTLKITVTDRSGGDVSNATISVVDEEGREHTGILSYNEVMSGLGEGFKYDEMRVGPLPPGRYTVTATTPDGRRAKKPVTLDGKRADRSVKMRLK